MDFQVSIIGIILILTLYLPGYFFRRFYFSGFSTKQFGTGEWYDRFFISILLGIVVQVITIKILRDNFQVDFNSVSEPIGSVYTNILEKKVPSLDFYTFVKLVSYLLVSLFFGSVFGIFTRSFVRRLKLDIYTSTLKYANIWHYYFRGDITKTKDFKRSLSKKGRWVSTEADILMDFQKDDKNILYSGIISQYDLSGKSEKLERVYMTKSKRYCNSAKCFKEIPGDILILDASRILNINLTYVFLEKKMGKKSNNAGSAALAICLLLIAFSPVVLIPYFLYGSIPTWRVIVGIFESLAFIILIASISRILLTKNDEFMEKYKTGKSASLAASIIVTFFLFIITIFTLFS